MSAPSVYAAINAITSQLARNGIAKTHTTEVHNYRYRSIDDVLNRLAPLLAEHRLCVLPKMLEREDTERLDEQGAALFRVVVRASFTLVSVDDGTSHEVATFGEALDSGDKATAKAMSAAYKAAMLQTFCIPVEGAEDADRTSHRPRGRLHASEPVQGWAQWCHDIEDIVSLCESEQAISVVQERNRASLMALSREQPDLYKSLGESFAKRRQVLLKRADDSKPERSSAKSGRRKASKKHELLQNA